MAAALEAADFIVLRPSLLHELNLLASHVNSEAVQLRAGLLHCLLLSAQFALIALLAGTDNEDQNFE